MHEVFVFGLDFLENKEACSYSDWVELKLCFLHHC